MGYWGLGPPQCPDGAENVFFYMAPRRFRLVPGMISFGRPSSLGFGQPREAEKGFFHDPRPFPYGPGLVFRRAAFCPRLWPASRS